MPSVHVAWALIVGLAAVVVSTSRWRWLVAMHPVLTVVAVTVTANHWYGDGIVAAGILGLSLVIAWAAELAWMRLGLPVRSAEPPGDLEPELQPA